MENRESGNVDVELFAFFASPLRSLRFRRFSIAKTAATENKLTAKDAKYRKEPQSNGCLTRIELEDATVSHHVKTGNKPFINVTPLIDVLLVMLIIFMVAAPLKPSRFTAKIPAEPDDRVLQPDPKTLLVTIQPDRKLKLNGLTDDMGTVEDPSKLSTFLISLFRQRKANHVYRAEMLSRVDLPEDYRIEKTVFIKAPRSIAYGEVVKVIDGLKGAGADPVGLQLDALN